MQSFFLRLSVVIIFHLLFKQGDQTFSGAFEPSLRSLVFSLYFVIYWMLFWKVCSLIYNKLVRNSQDKRIWYRRLFLVTTILLLLVIAGSLIFSYGYALMDDLFGIVSTDDVPFLNPALFGSFDILKSIKINPELLFGFILFFILVYGAHIFITSVKNMKELEVAAAQQKKESITAQYTALKNQVDPHFFFNSLSVLSSLIYEDTELSAAYISHLAKHYRYILETNTDNVVIVEKELEILDSYYFLIKIRYQDLINLIVKLSAQTRSGCRILPHSLLMLAENAVKHNVFTKENLLVVEILEDEEYIIVRNNISRRKLLQESTGIGLKNIRKRYALESNKEVLIEESGNYFVVKLPKLS
ncbi:MAG: histidine kinase [Bacteroidales bacterium]|nr:histidine kinase [Bacteroidales bacterium]